jgi:hypothetical protein
MRQWLALGMMGMAASTSAAPAMVADTGDEGQVVLTGERHDACGRQRMAYLTRPLDPAEPGDTITFWGCWDVARNVVHVKYFIGTEGRYRRADFNYEDVMRIAIPDTDPVDEAEESYGPSL